MRLANGQTLLLSLDAVLSALKDHSVMKLQPACCGDGIGVSREMRPGKERGKSSEII